MKMILDAVNADLPACYGLMAALPQPIMIMQKAQIIASMRNRKETKNEIIH